jgi:NAD(P)-dependent dehydrogenase (short-subunit alcohol dehydrogenase family)
MQVVLPHFKARKTGVLVNVPTMLSRIPEAIPRAAYSAAKAALNSLTESLRSSWRRTTRHPGLLVLPGVVATDFGNSAIGRWGRFAVTIPRAQSVEELATGSSPTGFFYRAGGRPYIPEQEALPRSRIGAISRTQAWPRLRSA